MEPLVSVIIPCYNQGNFLHESITSVLAQTYPNHEIIVVDDGSLDDVASVVARYPPARSVRQENGGVAAARNHGISESRGKYLVFLDADDRLLPNALEQGVNSLNAHPGAAFVFGFCKFITHDGALVRTPRQKLVEREHYLELLNRNYIFCPASVMYRRSLFDKTAGFDTTLRNAEDWEMYLRVARTHQIHAYQQEVAEYRQHQGGKSRNSARMLEATLRIMHRQRQYVKGNQRYEAAYRSGIEHKQNLYGKRVIKEIRQAIAHKDYMQAATKLRVFLRYYPKGLRLLAGHVPS